MRVLNVEKLIESQSQKHRERLLGQYSRLLDSSPSFVTYYSIDGVNSTAELGTRDIMDYVGPDSPVKFKKINNMPMYSLNAITAEIVYDETIGTYTEFEDQGLILQSVIRPLPGDHFTVDSFNPEVIFTITDVKVRAIRGEDHYIVEYSVVMSSRILEIQPQVVENYETIFRNIGTEDKVLIKREDYNQLRDYMESYRLLHDRYVDENFDEEIGYLKTPEWLEGISCFGTCKYVIKFLMDNRVVYFDEILESIFAFETVLPFESKHNKLYTRTFPLNQFIKRSLTPGSLYVVFRDLPISLFKEVYDEDIGQSIEFKFVESGGENTPDYKELLLYDEEFINQVLSADYESMSPMVKVISKFIHDEDISSEEYDAVPDDYEVTDLFRYYFIPLILVILKVKIKSLQV